MPVWMYHPEKGARLFASPDDVPDGWADSPDFDNAQWIERVPEPKTEKEPEPESGKKKAAVKRKGAKKK